LEKTLSFDKVALQQQSFAASKAQLLPYQTKHMREEIDSEMCRKAD